MALTLFGGARSRASMPRWCYEDSSTYWGFGEDFCLTCACLHRREKEEIFDK